MDLILYIAFTFHHGKFNTCMNLYNKSCFKICFIHLETHQMGTFVPKSIITIILFEYRARANISLFTSLVRHIIIPLQQIGSQQDIKCNFVLVVFSVNVF